ncbi:MAG: cbb3-type cytochrome oxidase assembly protein CcoS [Pseudomonadota bacterium]
MSIAYLLVSLGLGVLVFAVWALFWAVDSGQFDDLESQGSAILEDDPAAPHRPEPPSGQ